MNPRIQFCLSSGAKTKTMLLGDFDSVVYAVKDGKMYFSWLDRLMKHKVMPQISDTRRRVITPEDMMARIKQKGFVPIHKCKLRSRLVGKIPPVEEWRWVDKNENDF